jgi:hypothetical protein
MPNIYNMNKRKLSTWIAFLGGLSVVSFAVTTVAAIWIEGNAFIGKLCISEIVSMIFLGIFYAIAREIED